MTVPEDHDDRRVIDILGSGTPESAEPVVSAPLTRRELRERESRVDDAASVSKPRRRGVSAMRSRARANPRRTIAKIARRDAVRVAAVKKTISKRLLSFGAMLFAGALAFGMTVPANAFDTGVTEQKLAESLTLDSQSAQVVDPAVASVAARDAWTVTSWAEMLRLRYGTRSFDYSVGGGAIRWPFPYTVPISSGFGDRAAPCRGCSTSHSGIDFNPGHGAAIFAIADGVVVEHGAGGSSWGHFVVIEHQIDGQTVYSGYAHMVSGSSPLSVGDPVKVGDFVGLVGATGQATGSHLHFTISIGAQNAFVDPFTFLKRYAS